MFGERLAIAGFGHRVCATQARERLLDRRALHLCHEAGKVEAGFMLGQIPLELDHGMIGKPAAASSAATLVTSPSTSTTPVLRSVPTLFQGSRRARYRDFPKNSRAAARGAALREERA